MEKDRYRLDQITLVIIRNLLIFMDSWAVKAYWYIRKTKKDLTLWAKCPKSGLRDSKGQYLRDVTFVS